MFRNQKKKIFFLCFLLLLGVCGAQNINFKNYENIKRENNFTGSISFSNNELYSTSWHSGKNNKQLNFNISSLSGTINKISFKHKASSSGPKKFQLKIKNNGNMLYQKELKTDTEFQQKEIDGLTGESLKVNFISKSNKAINGNSISNKGRFYLKDISYQTNKNLQNGENKKESTGTGEKISILTGSKQKLKTISGIGTTISKNIINYRKNNKICKYKTILKVDGIGDTLLKKIKNKTYLKTNKNCNEKKNGQDKDKEEEEEKDKFEISSSDIDLLTKISGIGESSGEKIINFFNNNLVCSINDLRNINGIGPSKIENIKNKTYLKKPDDCKNQKDEDQNKEDQKENDNNDNEEDEDKKEKYNYIIDINSANKNKLTNIEGIGNSYAQNIIDEQPFCQIKELLSVDGIGQSTLASIKDKKNIFLQPPEKCFTKQNPKNNYNKGKLKILEVHLGGKLPNYIQVQAVNGMYSGNVEIKGLGRGNSSRQLKIKLLSGSNKVITHSLSGFQNKTNIKKIQEQIYLTSSGQKLKLIKNNGDIMDKIAYEKRKKGKSNYFSYNKSQDEYRKFNKLDYPTPGFTVNDLNYYFKKNKNNNKDCPYSLNINSNKFFTGTVSYQINTNADKFKIKYWITDFFGNKVVKTKETDNTNTKIFTPNQSNSEIFKIHAKLITNKCNKKQTLNVGFANQNKLKKDFNKLSNKVKKAGYIIEDNFDIRAPRTDKTYKQLYEQEKSKSKNNTTKTTQKHQNKANDKNFIKINSSSQKKLTKIKGIGSKYAKNIVNNRPFCQFKDLLDIDGIGPSRLKRLKESKNIVLQAPNSCFTNKSSKKENKNYNIIKINSSKEKKLTQIKGIGSEYAKNIINNRPICNYKELKKIKGIGAITVNKIQKDPQVYIDTAKHCKDKKESSKKTKQHPKTKTDYIYINSSPKKDLTKIDGVGKETAKKIIKKRPLCGFQNILEIDGIGKTTIKNILTNKSIILDYIAKCEYKSKNNKNQKGKLKITEINPGNQKHPEFITIKSYSGNYIGDLKVQGIGRGNSSESLNIEIYSGDQLTISDEYFNYKGQKLKVIDSIYLNNKGQQIKLITPNGQELDSIKYTTRPKNGKVLKPKSLKTTSKNPRIFDKKVFSKNIKYQESNKDSNKSEKTNTKDILINKLYPGSNKAEYLQLHINGTYSGTLTVQGLGHGQNSKSINLNTNGGYIYITDDPKNLKVKNKNTTKTLDYISLTQSGQELTLLDESGQQLDKIMYTGYKENTPVQFGLSYSGSYRLPYQKEQNKFNKNILKAYKKKNNYIHNLLKENRPVVYKKSNIQKLHEDFDKIIQNIKNGKDKTSLYGIKINTLNIKKRHRIKSGKIRPNDYVQIIDNSIKNINIQKKLKTYKKEFKSLYKNLIINTNL